MLELALSVAVGAVIGIVFMWFWYPYNLAKHPEKIAALQARAERLTASASDLFQETLDSIRQAQK
jgi:hypothetical protein